MKIIFAGTPEFAANSLQAIVDSGHTVIATYTQPDRPAGRGKKLLKSDVKLVAERNSIPVYQPEKLTDASAQQQLADLAPDLMIVAAYGLILPKKILETPAFGCVNIHASLLPRWRGAAPIQRAIQAGDTETGITIMQMDEGLDTGDMLFKEQTSIKAEDTGGSLHDRLAEIGANCIVQYLDQIRQDPQAYVASAQDDTKASYAHKLTKQEAEIDWSLDARQICSNIRAFNPWPVSYCFASDARIRIFEAEHVTHAESKLPGTVLEKTKAGILVKCGVDAIRIKKLQFPGGKAIDAQSFVNGGKPLLNPGDILVPEVSK